MYVANLINHNSMLNQRRNFKSNQRTMYQHILHQRLVANVERNVEIMLISRYRRFNLFRTKFQRCNDVLCRLGMSVKTKKNIDPFSPLHLIFSCVWQLINENSTVLLCKTNKLSLSYSMHFRILINLYNVVNKYTKHFLLIFSVYVIMSRENCFSVLS